MAQKIFLYSPQGDATDPPVVGDYFIVAHPQHVVNKGTLTIFYDGKTYGMDGNELPDIAWQGESYYSEGIYVMGEVRQ